MYFSESSHRQLVVSYLLKILLEKEASNCIYIYGNKVYSASEVPGWFVLFALFYSPVHHNGDWMDDLLPASQHCQLLGFYIFLIFRHFPYIKMVGFNLRAADEPLRSIHREDPY